MRLEMAHCQNYRVAYTYFQAGNEIAKLLGNLLRYETRFTKTDDRFTKFNVFRISVRL